MQKATEVKDLIKDYGNFRALKGISFEVNQGEIFGLIGPNAAGKTTALRVISTLLQTTSGEVKVFGYNVIKEADKVRERISYLPEEAGAYKNLSGKAYLKFMASFYSTSNEEEIEIMERGIELAKLGKRLKNKVSTYSKGMSRRLLLARALMINPKSYQHDGCEKSVSQVLTPISLYNTGIVSGFLIDWVNFIECDKFPVLIEAYRQAAYDLIMTEYQEVLDVKTTEKDADNTKV